MEFDSGDAQKALFIWRQTLVIKERAEADNIWFEDRVSKTRQEFFERHFGAVVGWDKLRRAQVDYIKEFVEVDGDLPHTFSPLFKPASLGHIDASQRIVRVESLAGPLQNAGIDFEVLLDASKKGQFDVLDWFVKSWNDLRDSRPRFAAWKDEILAELEAPDWPERLRDRLGLAHYDCRSGPIPIALMEYSVFEVLEEKPPVPDSCAFVAPTVLDSAPWPFFFRRRQNLTVAAQCR